MQYINHSLNNQNNIFCYRRFDFTSEIFIFIVFYFLLLSWNLYSSMWRSRIQDVTCRLILMKVKVCYACVHMTGTFRHQNRPKHAVFDKRLKRKQFSGEGDMPPPQTPPPMGRGTPPPHAPLPSAPSPPRSSRLWRSTFVPPNEMSGSATGNSPFKIVACSIYFILSYCIWNHVVITAN